MSEVYSVGGSPLTHNGFLLSVADPSTLTVSLQMNGTYTGLPVSIPIKVVCSGHIYTFWMSPGDTKVLSNLQVSASYAVTIDSSIYDMSSLGYTLYSASGDTGKISLSGSSCVLTIAYSQPTYDTLDKPKAMRIWFHDTTFSPDSSRWVNGVTWTQISQDPNLWDIQYLNSDWSNLLATRSSPGAGTTPYWQGLSGTFEVISIGDLSGITDASGLFGSTYSGDSSHPLESSVPLYLPDATTVAGMFSGCSNLEVAPSLILPSLSANNGLNNLFSNCSSLVTAPIIQIPANSTVHWAERMFSNCSSLENVPLYDFSSLTRVSSMFNGCSSLVEVPTFDLGNVQNMDNMFYSCSNLRTIPLFNTHSVTSVNYAFGLCQKVESGSLALYTQMSTQTTPPSSHTSTFMQCGTSTTTGAAELAQIPSSWGGTGS